MLEEKVREALLGPCGVHTGDVVLAAVSGGADSVALLHALYGMAKAGEIRLEAAHFEHGIRGGESLDDARFVRALCDTLQIPLHEGSADVPALARAWKNGLEDAARQARYAFLQDCAANGGIKAVALAHHMQDQAETLLLHAARGSAGRGLCAMQARSGLYVRPMLGVNRSEVLAYLDERGLSWREDSTNASLEPARNRVRHTVMPSLRSVNPRVEEALCRLAGMARRDEAYFDEALKSLCLPAPIGVPYGLCMPLKPLRPLHPALLSRALYGFLVEAGVKNLSYECLERLENTVRMGGTCSLTGGFTAHAGWTHLHVVSEGFSPETSFEIPLQEALAGRTLPLGGCLRHVPGEYEGLGDGIRRQALRTDALSGAVVRYRRPGDRFWPLGAAGAQKFKQTMIDCRLDRPFRDLVPLIADKDRILWAIGLRVSQEAAVLKDGRGAEYLAFSGRLPWL
ncbi:tRNA lysidine(34) synthetase TilS [Beduinella massiliensis]|uniref:tRNA lysidine(34) synthetase TilS n=1 Tax=Beduinella massiliensis TaxID=1852363 RepID=UPI0031F8C768